MAKILQLDVAAELTNRANVSGTTPLEAVQSKMTSIREFAENLLPVWKGHAADYLAIEYLLKQAMGHSIDRDMTTYIFGRRFGCTCGECADGWLSPRMRFRLGCRLLAR